MEINRQVVLTRRPVGVPQQEHFDIVESPVARPGDGEILVKVSYLSVEPAMRGWVNDAANYSEPVALGDVMRSYAAGTVTESRNPDFAVGDDVMGWFGWQQYKVTDGRHVVRKIADRDLPISLSLGVLG